MSTEPRFRWTDTAGAVQTAADLEAFTAAVVEGRIPPRTMIHDATLGRAGWARDHPAYRTARRAQASAVIAATPVGQHAAQGRGNDSSTGTSNDGYRPSWKAARGEAGAPTGSVQRLLARLRGWWPTATSRSDA